MNATSTTPGGDAIRSLRAAARRTQLWVELEAELGTGYLQRIESGRVSQPTRKTIERILDALEARYSERREIMQSFGYIVTTPKPDPGDIRWAREVSRRQLRSTDIPVYVLDCSHRLTAWNDFIPWLFDVTTDVSPLDTLRQHSVLGTWFDPESFAGKLVRDPDTVLPAMIRAFRYEMHLFGREPWYKSLLQELHAQPRFRHYWACVESETQQISAARALIPLKLQHPRLGPLSFRLSSEPFIRDARFRFVHFFPADARTMKHGTDFSESRAFGNEEIEQVHFVDFEEGE